MFRLLLPSQRQRPQCNQKTSTNTLQQTYQAHQQRKRPQTQLQLKLTSTISNQTLPRHTRRQHLRLTPTTQTRQNQIPHTQPLRHTRPRLQHRPTQTQTTLQPHNLSQSIQTRTRLPSTTNTSHIITRSQQRTLHTRLLPPQTSMPIQNRKPRQLSRPMLLRQQVSTNHKRPTTLPTQPHSQKKITTIQAPLQTRHRPLTQRPKPRPQHNTQNTNQHLQTQTYRTLTPTLTSILSNLHQTIQPQQQRPITNQPLPVHRTLGTFNNHTFPLYPRLLPGAASYNSKKPSQPLNPPTMPNQTRSGPMELTPDTPNIANGRHAQLTTAATIVPVGGTDTAVRTQFKPKANVTNYNAKPDI